MRSRGFRARLGIPADAFVVLFLGRMHRIKRLDLLADAFAAARATHPADAPRAGRSRRARPDARSPAPARPAPRGHVHAIGAIHGARQVGAREGRRRDGAVLRLGELRPVGVESLAAGVPVDRHPHLSVERDRDRTAAASGSSRRRRRSPRRSATLADDPARRARMGERASAFARDRYSWDTIAPQMARLLRGAHITCLRRVVVLTPNLCGRDGISRLARLVTGTVRRGDGAGVARTGVGDAASGAPACAAPTAAPRDSSRPPLRSAAGRGSPHPRDRHPPAPRAGGAGVRGARRVADDDAVRRRGVEAGEPAAARGARARRRADRDLRSSRATAFSRRTRVSPAARSRSAISASSRCRTREAAPAEPPSALIVGRMAADERYKGHDPLLEIWRDVVAAVPGASLRIVGDGDDRARLERKAASLALGDRVIVSRPARRRGARSASTQRCTAFVMPSRDEGFGFVFVEAMRAARACVGSLGAAAEIIADGETGLLVEPDDRTQLLQAVVRLLRDRPATAAMGARGRARFLQQFTEARFRDRFTALAAGGVMNILGLNAYHGDVSAALVRDGQLVAAVEEERYRRIKHVAGFPRQAMPRLPGDGRDHAVRRRRVRGVARSARASLAQGAVPAAAPAEGHGGVARAQPGQPARAPGDDRGRSGARRGARAAAGCNTSSIIPRIWRARRSSRRSTKRRSARSTASATSSARRGDASPAPRIDDRRPRLLSALARPAVPGDHAVPRLPELRRRVQGDGPRRRTANRATFARSNRSCTCATTAVSSSTSRTSGTGPTACQMTWEDGEPKLGPVFTPKLETLLGPARRRDEPVGAAARGDRRIAAGRVYERAALHVLRHVQKATRPHAASASPAAAR